MNMTEWAKREVEIVKEDKTGDEELCRYADGCYDSALKAFLSLCEDGHSGMSIGFTLGILNRLVKGLPLSPIEAKLFIPEVVKGLVIERISQIEFEITKLKLDKEELEDFLEQFADDV